MKGYLVFLISLFVVEGALLWGLETAVRSIVRNEEHAVIYRWAIRILAIEIAHYATCAYILWDISIVYPMLIPVLTLIMLLVFLYVKDKRRKIKEYQDGYPKIPDMLVRMSTRDDGKIVTVKSIDDLSISFMKGDTESTFFISPESETLFQGEQKIFEWNEEEKVIGSLVPCIEGTEYALLLYDLGLQESWTVSVFKDIGMIEVSYMNKTLFEIREKNQEGFYDVFCLRKGDPIWQRLMRS